MKSTLDLRKQRKTNKGITLIALAITIIILLILAGVSIATLTGENGILTKATSAKEKHLEEKMKEEIELRIMEAQIQEKGFLTYENLCHNYLIPKDYHIEDSEDFGMITKDTDEYKGIIIYIDKDTLELSFEKDVKYETCKVILQTDNDFNNFENINMIVRNAQTGTIMQQYTVLEGETEHDFLIKSGIRYTVSVSELKNAMYEYTSPTQTELIEALGDNTREIKMSYKEKIVYLYNYGVLCTSISGGWNNDFKANNPTPYAEVDPTFNTNNITLSLPKTAGRECLIGRTNKVDITNYSKVCINYEYDIKPVLSRPLCIFPDKLDFPTTYVAQITNNGCVNGVSSIDISNIIGSYYIGSGVWNPYSGTAVANSRIIYQV